jgi:iron-sulfur cluster repair protein YtfE (RIC family)
MDAAGSLPPQGALVYPPAMDDTPDIPAELALETRAALPEELAFLLPEYPRAAWEGHPNAGQWAEFWLARHNMFRDFGAALPDAVAKLDAKEVEAEAFHQWFMPRASFFLGELDTHHKVEEYHYFPLLARADQRMERGIALLESDHHRIHELLYAAYETIVTMDSAVRETPEKTADAIPRLRDALAALEKGLVRHLDDEEDLVMPLILDRGEAALGIH